MRGIEFITGHMTYNPTYTLGAEYLFFFSCLSLQMREKYSFSLSQFVYLFREVCLLFNFLMINVPNGFF